MDLGKRVSLLKNQNHLTTETLARLSGVPKGTINKILNGETQNPTARTLSQLARALGCTPGDLCATDSPPASGRCGNRICPRPSPRSIPIGCPFSVNLPEAPPFPFPLRPTPWPSAISPSSFGRIPCPIPGCFREITSSSAARRMWRTASWPCSSRETRPSWPGCSIWKITPSSP